MKIDEPNRFVETSRISFYEFVKGIELDVRNHLILSGFPSDSNWSRELFLEYVDTEQLEEFYKEDVYSYGDFCWVDFKNIDNLKKITGQELAELLYMSHKKEPLNDFCIESLENKFAYLCHDDGYWNKVYMKNIGAYKKVIEYKILKELKGKKKSISPIPKDIMNELYHYFKQGAVMDFEKSYITGVTIYQIKNTESMDDIHSKLDRIREGIKNGIRLNYNRNSKKWTLV